MSATDINMDQGMPKKKFRLILDFKHQFPDKLYDVANDGYLIYWNRNGSISVRNEDEFENNVMKLYPGFLQIPSFANFRRLFREYGFDRDINQNGALEFSHPLFVRGRRELLQGIKTRRKSGRVPHIIYAAEADVIIPTENNKRYSTRKRRRTAHFSPDTSDKTVNVDLGAGGDIILNPIPTHDSQIFQIKRPNGISNSDGKTDSNEIFMPMKHSSEPTQSQETKNYSTLMDGFAEKEFNEEEYKQWLTKRRKMDEAKIEVEEKTVSNSKEFWWMYGETTDDIVKVDRPAKKSDGEIQMCTPCGFCKCCTAISNYVHIFGEVPENIQVFDYVEEVVTTDTDTDITLESA